MDRPRTRPALRALALGLGLGVFGSGCAHRREVIYPSGPPVQVQTGRGVHVRAPFVDVQVPEASPDIEVDDLD
jgi:hypothetical protein